MYNDRYPNPRVNNSGFAYESIQNPAIESKYVPIVPNSNRQ